MEGTLSLLFTLSLQSSGSVTKHLDGGQTLSFSGVTHGESHGVEVGISPWLGAMVLGFSPVNETLFWEGRF